MINLLNIIYFDILNLIMKLISHRGNISKKIPSLENHPDYIMDAVKKGYDVEIDVRLHKNRIYLGHDKPQYLLTDKLLKFSSKLWFHAKNLEALPYLKKNRLIYFWHQTDDVVLTSNGFWWTYPGKKLFKNSICVLPKKFKKNIICAGICSDEIERFNND